MKKFYNLADIIFNFNFEKASIFSEKSIANQYVKEYTIKYLNGHSNEKLYSESKQKPIDYDLLRKIVSKHKLSIEKQLINDSLVIHLRIGDVFKEAPSIKKYIEIIKKYKLNSKTNFCYLFYGFHKEVNIEESINYIEELEKQLILIGFQVEKISGKPDDDFAHLSNAKYYIPGIRAYGLLSAAINPNTVIWDLHNPPKFNWLRSQKNLENCLRGYYFQKNK